MSCCAQAENIPMEELFVSPKNVVENSVIATTPQTPKSGDSVWNLTVWRLNSEENCYHTALFRSLLVVSQALHAFWKYTNLWNRWLRCNFQFGKLCNFLTSVGKGLSVVSVSLGEKMSHFLTEINILPYMWSHIVCWN